MNYINIKTRRLGETTKIRRFSQNLYRFFERFRTLAFQYCHRNNNSFREQNSISENNQNPLRSYRGRVILLLLDSKRSKECIE